MRRGTTLRGREAHVRGARHARCSLPSARCCWSPRSRQRPQRPSLAPQPHAPSAIIIDRVTGRVLYGKGIHHERPMASTTKIMTALLVVQRAQPRPPDRGSAAPSPSSGIGLEPGERITDPPGPAGADAQERPGLRRDARDPPRPARPAVRRLDEREGAQAGPARHALPTSPATATPRHHSSVYDLAGSAATPCATRASATSCGASTRSVRWGDGRALQCDAQQPPAALRLGGRRQVRVHRGRRLLPGGLGPARPAAVHHATLAARAPGRTRATTWRCSSGRRRCTRRRPW